MSDLFKLNLQLFADGGAAAAAGGAEGATAEGALATQGVQTNTNDGGMNLQDEFNGLVGEGGKYKAEFDSRVRAAVESRVKNLKGYEQQYNAVTPLLQALGERYGVDPRDTQGLENAFFEDTTYLEQEALEHGLTPEQLRDFRRLEFQNKQLQQREAQARAMQDYNRWCQEADEIKSSLNPGFDLDTEIQNPEFRNLLGIPGMSVKTAYMALHGEEMMQAGMRYATQKAAQNTVNDIKARGTRPQENGVSSVGAVQTKTDVSKLTPQQMKEINERVRRGEIITFD